MHAPSSSFVVHVAQWRALLVGLLLAVCMLSGTAVARDLTEVIEEAQPKIVKIYGAGGFRGLEGYQSGFLISAHGHILTAWSTVLDSDEIKVTLDDGRRYQGTLVGADPVAELAVLKIEAADLPCFPLVTAVSVEPGAPVLAFSNLFGVATGDEPVSVQRGIVAAKAPLTARRGTFESPYRGMVYVLDTVTNNPGGAGGALTDIEGRLVGMLGKELRHATANTWLNYSLPVEELAGTIDEIISGKFVRSADAKTVKPAEALQLAALGIRLVPDVLPRTPPYVDAVIAGSPAAMAGIRPDDLIVFIDERLVASCQSLVDELSYIERLAEVAVTYKRGNELTTVKLRGQGTAQSEAP
ncbi:MAG: trypsin-like peptidase domain-containing protein [Pirellulales bacterium]|nr:trypsin-like peptidase domain-containing protein [Pirellulales bacterium]